MAESELLLVKASMAAETPQARFVVQFYTTFRDVRNRSATADQAVDRLRALVTNELEELMLAHVETMQAHQRGSDPRPTLHAAIHLSQRLCVPFWEAHFLHDLARVELPDPHKARHTLERVTALPGDLRGVLVTERQYLWSLVHVLEGDVDAAVATAQAAMEAPDLLSQSYAGYFLAILAAGRFHSGDAEGGAKHLAEARRRLGGTEHESFLHWVERVAEGGELLPLPLVQSHRGRSVASDGSWFSVEGRRVDLENHPVSKALLAYLAAGPTPPDTLIEGVWPGDASSYTSLKSRLHSAVRGLRQQGFEGHLVFSGGVYSLDGVEVVDVALAGD